jgi:hypothetical protein
LARSFTFKFDSLVNEPSESSTEYEFTFEIFDDFRFSDASSELADIHVALEL